MADAVSPRAHHPGEGADAAAAASPVWRTAAAGLLGLGLVVALARIPWDPAAGAVQEDLLLAATVALAGAAGAILLLRYPITGSGHDLFAGVAQIALAAGHLAIVQIEVGGDPLLGTRLGPALYLSGQIVAIAGLTLRATTPPIERRAGRLLGALVVVTGLVPIALVTRGSWQPALRDFAQPGPGRGLVVGLVVSGLWFVVILVAVNPAFRRSAMRRSPAMVVLAGSALAALAPATASVLGGDPARSRAVLAAGTALGACIMAGDALRQTLRRQRERLLESELDRLRADGERAARSELDHDLAAALLAVEGAARALERREARASGADSGTLAGAMAAEIGRLKQLVAGVDEAADIQTFHIGAAILPVVACDLARGVDIRVEVPGDLIARGSPVATAQVVRNLLDNAQRYAPGCPISVTGRTDGGFVCITVDDEGAGVAMEERERIFERGERGANPTEDGSGLGLYVAARMMRNQGGRLELGRGPGGSFSLQLPVAARMRARG